MAVFIKTKYTPAQLREELQKQKAAKVKQLKGLHGANARALNAWASKLRRALLDEVVPFLLEVSTSVAPEKLLLARGRRAGGVTSLCSLPRAFVLPAMPDATESRDLKREIERINERLKSLENCDEKQVFRLTAASYTGFTQGLFQG